MFTDSGIKFLPQSSEGEEKKNVRATAIDTHMYNDSISDIDSLRKKLFNNNKKNEFVSQLTEDLFHCLYKVNPEVHHENSVVEEQKLSNRILSQVIKNENFAKLRSYTATNLFNSTLSLSSVQDDAMRIMSYLGSEEKESMEELFDNISKAKQTRENIETLEKQGEDTSQLEQQLETLTGNISSGMSENKEIIDKMVEHMSYSFKETADTVEKVDQVLKGFGSKDSKDLGNLSHADRLKLAELLERSYTFRNICDQLGRMTEMLKKVGKKPSRFGHSYCDVGLGNNVTKLLSSEKLKLSDSELENDFFKRYTSKTLLEFKVDGTEDGKGPIVVCLDESGSMRGIRDTWAKAFCAACIQIAVRQNRECKIITFSSRVGRTFHFNKKNFSMSDLNDFFEYFMSGGTNFDRPLVEAMYEVEKKTFKKADILFVTDGDPDSRVCSSIIDNINRAKSKSGLQIQSVLIGNGVEESYVKDFSDSIVRVSDLSNDGVIIDVFSNVQR